MKFRDIKPLLKGEVFINYNDKGINYDLAYIYGYRKGENGINEAETYLINQGFGELVCNWSEIGYRRADFNKFARNCPEFNFDTFFDNYEISAIWNSEDYGMLICLTSEYE